MSTPKTKAEFEVRNEEVMSAVPDEGDTKGAFDAVDGPVGLQEKGPQAITGELASTKLVAADDLHFSKSSYCRGEVDQEKIEDLVEHFRSGGTPQAITVNGEGTFGTTIAEASAIQDWPTRVRTFKDIAMRIGKANEDMIRSCDVVLGVLDGAELDSGTVSEIGFGAALGKKCCGLRTDYRHCGDFDGILINLQVLYWIEANGGKLLRKIEEITGDAFTTLD